MKNVLLVVLLACFLLPAYSEVKQGDRPASQPSDATGKARGTVENPVFVKEPKTRAEEEAAKQQVKDATENLDIQRKTLDINQKALTANEGTLKETAVAATAAAKAAIFAGLAFVATLITILVSGYQAWVARRSAHFQLRAYVAVDTIRFEDGGMVKPKRPKIYIKNFGHTPANSVTIRSSDISIKQKEDFTAAFVNNAYKAPRQLLAPTQTYSTWTHHPTMYRPEYFGQKTVEQNGDQTEDIFVVFGAITYADVYGAWWVTRFCHRYDGPNGFIPYTDYNCENKYTTEREALDSLFYVSQN